MYRRKCKKCDQYCYSSDGRDKQWICPNCSENVCISSQENPEIVYDVRGKEEAAI